MLLCYLFRCKNTKSLLSIIEIYYEYTWETPQIINDISQGISKMSVYHKTYFSQPRNDWLCIFSNYCAFLKTTGLSLCTSRIIMIYELFLLQLLSRHIICVAGIKSINISLKMGVWQTRYESFSDGGEIRVYFASKILTPCRMHWNAFLIAQIIAKCHSFPNM